MTSLTNNNSVDATALSEKPSEVTLDIIKSMSNKIRLVDSDENMKLELYCYLNYSEDDDPILKKCRGVVFNGTELVVKAFPYTEEILENNIDTLKNKLENKINSFNIYESHEGCLIRMFYFEDRWLISTHRKLNAFRSKWASKESFGTNFKKAIEHLYSNDETFKNSISDTTDTPLLEKFQNVLDKSKQYMFLLRNTFENRIVCVAPENPTVLHVGTIENGILNTEDFCNIPKPRKLDFADYNELDNYISNIDIREIQGLICFSKYDDSEHFKIIKQEYDDFFKARGNESSIKFRYLQVRTSNKDYTDRLYVLYPHMNSQFTEIEEIIASVGNEIYNSYVNRFIRKKFVTLPTEDYNVMREAHKWHESDRSNNRVSEQKINEILNQQPPTAINKMIRRWKIVKEMNSNSIEDTQRKSRSNTITEPNDEN